VKTSPRAVITVLSQVATVRCVPASNRTSITDALPVAIVPNEA